MDSFTSPQGGVAYISTLFLTGLQIDEGFQLKGYCMFLKILILQFFFLLLFKSRLKKTLGVAFFRLYVTLFLILMKLGK